MASTWTVASAQPTDARGDEHTPAPRYGHGAAICNDIMTITHGYYFDHERCKPMFLDDTWEYHTTHKKWRYRSLGSVRPCKRFHVQYAWDASHLYLFGGTDGGLRVNKGENFIFGPRAEFNDLWRLQLNEESARWEKLHGGSDETYNAVEGQDVPRKAHMGGCACAAGKVYTFGGLCGDESEEPDGLEALGELWSWNIGEAAWSRAKTTGSKPDARYGCGMVSDGDGFLLTGGRVRDKEDEDARKLFDDLWRLDTTTMAWSLLHRDPLLKRVDAAVCRAGNHLILWGGNVAEQPIAAEVPCDGVLYDDQFRACAPLPVRPCDVPSGLTEAPPFGRLHATLVSIPDGARRVLLLFGGESVHPHMYHGSVYEARLFLPGSSEDPPDLGDLSLAPAPAPAPAPA